MKGVVMLRDYPNRHHPAHGILGVEGQPTILFDTVCTKDRGRWLANAEVHAILQEVWLEADAWRMGRYMIMPDHIHYFAGDVGSVIDFKNWVKYWKSQFTKRYKHSNCRWLPDDWDTRMRSVQGYEEKWLYTQNNPVRQSLCDRPEDWPYQGQIHELRWD